MIALLPLLALVPLAILAGVFSYLLYNYLKFSRRASQVRETEVSHIRELANGPAVIRGHVVAQERLLCSPLTEAPCVYYHFTVEEQRSSYNGKTHTTYWANVVNDRQCLDVTVEDQTGAIDLDLGQAEVILEQNCSLNSGTFNDPPPRIERLLNDHYGVSTAGWVFNKAMRYREMVMFDDDVIVVVGEARVPPRGNPYFVNGEFPFIVSDKNPGDLAAHFDSTAMNYLIGTVIVGVIAVIALGFVLVFTGVLFI